MSTTTIRTRILSSMAAATFVVVAGVIPGRRAAGDVARAHAA